MKKLYLVLFICLAIFITACQQTYNYNIDGVIEIKYSNVDLICDEKDLRNECEKILFSMQKSNDILLSFVVDSSILIEDDELGEYDHLVIVNPTWIERFDDWSNLKKISLEDIPSKMKDFLNLQMPEWTINGNVLPDKVNLYEYTGSRLLSFPFMAGTSNDVIEAKNPLIIMIDEPVTSMDKQSFIIPLTSSTNLVFTDHQKLEKEIKESIISPYVSEIKEISLKNNN